MQVGAKVRRVTVPSRLMADPGGAISPNFASNLLLAGASSAPAVPVNETYFEGLRERVHGAAKVTGKTRRQP